ncbi:restriction endonuclease subunit S [Mammaliicoccus sciuri]|nr:restriction endonuclease subunit S [Mammaliicoccus sciuri]
MSAVALKDYKNATFNGFTKRLRPNKYCENKLLPVYAAFYFRSNNFRNQVNSMSIMSTRASLNNEMISKLKITIPSLQNQVKISHILLALLKKKKSIKKS